MSEHVERHLEGMPEELEEMRRIKIFSYEEVRLILKTRKEHEYKINGVNKSLQDFKNYIQYEKILLKDLHIRRNRMKLADKKGAIEYKIMKRIKNLYEIAMQRFSGDYNLCLEYFKFCREGSFHQAASLVIQNMTKRFSQNPDVWKLAASWYLKNNLNQALNVIHKGLTIHKDNQDLYLEAIQLELLSWEKSIKSEESQSQVQTDKKIKAYLESSYQHIKDCNFLIKIMSLLEKKNCMKDIQDSIVAVLMDKYSNEPSVWDALAQREYRGLHYGIPEFKKVTKLFRYKRCLDKYDEGIKVMEKVCPSAVPILQDMCLDWLVELYQQPLQSNSIILDDIYERFKKVSQTTGLEERYYIIWAKLLGDQEKVLEVLEIGFEKYPESLDLWKIRLKYEALKENVKKFNECFQKAVRALKEKAGPLWLMALRFHCITSSDKVLEQIYQAGVKQPKEVSDIIKPEYIQWLVLFRGIDEARSQYNELAKCKPFCKEMHMTMAKIEERELDVKLDKLENVYKLACEQFGHEDSDVWIALVEFYCKNKIQLKNKDRNFDIQENNLSIFKEAQRMLEGNSILLEDFREKFNKISQNVDP